MNTLPAITQNRTLQGEIFTPGDKPVTVAAAPHPFAASQVIRQFWAGMTIAEIVERVQPDPILRRYAHVFIGDFYILRDNWHRIRPKPGTLVTIRMIPKGGGGGGGKSPLRTILTIAVIVASIAMPALLPEGMAATNLVKIGAFELTVGKVVSGATLLIGGMLVNAIAPLPTPKLPSLGRFTGADRDSPTLFISGTRNEFRAFAPVPRVYGKHRIVPPFAALPYTELLGDNQFLRVLFCYGYGPLTVDEEVIGETALSAFTDVETEFRRGYQPSQLTSQGNWDASSAAYPVNPDFGDKWTVSVAGTTDGVAYKVGDTIIFNGLASATTSAAWDKNHDKPLTLFPDDVFEDQVGSTLTQAAGWLVRTTQTDADEISIDVFAPQGIVHFTNEGAKGSHTVVMEVESSPKGTNTWTSRGTITMTAAQTNAVRRGLRWATEARGQYDVRVRRTTADSNDSQIADGTVWATLRTFTNEHPIAMDGLCLKAMRIKATDQLQRTIEEYKAVVQAILPDWDSGLAEWVTRPTSNPAAAYRDALMGAANARPLTSARMDWDSIQDFAEWCTTKEFEFCMIRDFTSSVAELLDDITASARASKIIVDGKWGVTIDRPQGVEVQHFSPRNTWNFSGRRAFPDLPHAFQVKFINRNALWQLDQRTVYRDGYTSANATKFAGLEFSGVTNPDTIWKLARFHLAQVQLRLDEYTVETDFEYVVARRGSLVKLSHDVLSIGTAWGRIASYVLDGSNNVIQILLDFEVEMELGGEYGIVIRAGDGSSISRRVQTTSGQTTTVILTTTILEADTPDIGSLITFGEFGTETIDALVKTIEPGDELSAKITLMDYAVAIYSADTGTIPAYTSYRSTGIIGTAYPAVTSINSDETYLVKLSDSSWVSRVQVALGFASRRANSITGIEVQFREKDTGNTWTSILASSEAHEVFLQPVDDGVQYELHLRYIYSTGPGPWGPILTHTVIGASTPPDDVLQLVRDGDWALWTFTRPNDFRGFEVRYLPETNNLWALGFAAHEGFLTDNRFDLSQLPPGPLTIMVKAYDIAGNESVNAAVMYIDQGDITLVNVLSSIDYVALGFPGFITNGALDGTDLVADDDGGLYLVNGSAPYLPVDGALYLPVTYQEMSWLFYYTIPPSELPAAIVFAPTCEGLWNIKYRMGTDGLYLPIGGDPYLPVGSDPYLPPEFDSFGIPIPWPGSIDLTASPDYASIEFTVTTRECNQQGKVTVATISVDPPDEEETLDDIIISNTGTRLTLAKNYRSIKYIGYDIQDDGNGGRTLQVVDKDPDLGPLIKVRNAADTLVQGLIDFHIRGVKGP